MPEVCKFPLCKTMAQKNGFCIGHRHFAGSDLSDPEPTPVPKKSSKRKEDEIEYRKKGKAYLKAHPKCAGNFQNCTKVATTIHHKVGRTGSNYLDENTWIGLCLNCHQVVELNPSLAKEKKLSGSRLQKSEQ